MKHKKIRPEPITTSAIEKVCATQPGAQWTRLEICRVLGRGKTAHMIRMIEQAVNEDRIYKSKCNLSKGIDGYCYSWIAPEYTEEFFNVPIAGE